MNDVVVLDLRTPAELAWDGKKLPGAMWMNRRELGQRHQEIPRDKDVVLYCT